MADLIVTQDPANPGVFKINGPPITNNKVPLTSLATTGANPNDVITLSGGIWTPVAPSGVESASNLGAGSQVFKSKVSTDFQFRSLVAGTGIALTQNSDDITIATSGLAFSASFTSANQVITAGGPLTLAHGLGGMPTLIQLRLKNTSANLNYSIGDELILDCTNNSGGDNYGVSIVPDATNINVRFGSAATVFYINDKTTGGSGDIDITKWVFIVKAWK